ncbi:Na(+)/H(+) exchange regulatory cofactor NHE-RF4 isoform X3 [Dipodomys spectabilis]|uniref:Na(+)/H(+) exchange regulatory cofactor NHE-RF4 isoform X3 n=1 Tax=Dipodomys spectabilis TaxID=105255 RepID=UPI001C5374BF|nr:Na(+)/H(+) exchange regulatory cofactor NHE-RF4 isoform X3 [Dipodomys spectabilis]
MEAATVGLRDMASFTQKFKFNPKLGIDNPVLSLAEDHQDSSDPWNLKQPRFCLLSKEDGKSFGFHLQHQLGRAGDVVCRVEPGSSAQKQGLRVGDRILAVNSNVVDREDHIVVVRHIRASGPRVLLTVLAQHVYEVVQAQQESDACLCPLLGLGVRPRLCHIVRDEGGFGLSVIQGAQGSFWLALSAGGAAERAGVPTGARLLEVNGVSVDKFTYNQLSRKLWQSGEQVTLLVAGPEVEEQCRQLGMPLAAPLAEGWALPATPRCLHLEKGPQGFGFLLREEKGPDGRLGHFLWEVDPGLPAEKAGMQDGDRLVAVAGESVEGLSHEETVCRIRAQGTYVSLIVLDPEADRFFNMVTPGGSAARAGLETGDVVLEVNGCAVGGDNSPERLQQLSEAEPPLCLTLAARTQQSLEAWISPGSGEDWAPTSL